VRLQAGEKVGIVGRTGSGKSTLFAALYRLVEPASGLVLLDGVDVTKIGLRRLRDAFAAVPQDPHLFSGSIRANIDPWEEYDDATLWEVLERCYVADAVRAIGGLDSIVLGGGSGGFSSGQRQLLCLARAMLKRCAVLMLDEATASIDPHTDFLLQKTVRREFGHCTVLTVAHRLRTVVDADRVMVLDAGRVAEFDTPHALLTDPRYVGGSAESDRAGPEETKQAPARDSSPRGLFAALVDATGAVSAAALRRKAKETAEKNATAIEFRRRQQMYRKEQARLARQAQAEAVAHARSHLRQRLGAGGGELP
jgi:ABC-type protease/lipase transport system fused ATPase/permease subunit